MKNYTVTVNGTAYNVSVEEGTSSAPVASAPVAAAPAAPAAPVQESAPAAPAADASKGGSKGSVSIDAPMPGNILDVKTSVGAQVSTGDVLVILEAMKMENEIVAPQDGTVSSIEVNKGDSVESGATLVTLA